MLDVTRTEMTHTETERWLSAMHSARQQLNGGAQLISYCSIVTTPAT